MPVKSADVGCGGQKGLDEKCCVGILPTASKI